MNNDGQYAIKSEMIANLACTCVMPEDPNGCKSYLVFVHGAWSTAKEMLPFTQPMATYGYECCAPDLPGHGSSVRGGIGALSMDAYINSISNLVQKLGKVILVGHSMGGIIASQVAQKCRGRVKGFIGIASSGSALYTVSPRAALSAYKYRNEIRYELPLHLTEKDARTLYFNGIPEEEFQKYFGGMVPESGLAIKETLLWKYRARKLGCPSLLIKCTKDRVTPYQWMIALQLGAEVRTVKACHMAMYDNPVGVALCMRNWLEEVSGMQD